MDARNTAAAIVFLVALSLSFGYLRVQATGSCSQMTIPITVTAETESFRLGCPFPPQSWTIGSDICNVSRFPPYERCPNDTHECYVPNSDFLERGPTIVCCRGNCFEFKIDSVINHISVPPVIQAGKEVTIYATFAAKPLPPTFPSLIVDVINEPSVPTIVTSMQIVPSPTNDTEYIILHTFVVPLDFNKTTQIRPRFLTPPEGWRSLVELTFEPIGVVFPEVQPPTTTDAVTTTDPSVATTVNPTTTTTANVATASTAGELDATATIAPTTTNVMDITTMPGTAARDTTTVPGPMTSTVGFSPGSTCIGPGHVAAAAVGGMMAAIIVFIIFICVFIWYKRRKSYIDSKETIKSTSPHQPPPYGVPPRPNNMPFTTVTRKIPCTLVTQHSTPTPGYGETPADEATKLLHSSSRNHTAMTANSPAGVVNPGYSRQDSSLCSPHGTGPTLDRNSSNSPPTSGDTLRPLLKKNSSDSDDLSAAAAASTKDKRTEPLGTGLGDTSGAGASSSGAGARDPHGPTTVDSLEESKNHVYEELYRNGGLGHLPPSLRPLPPPPASESVRQNTHPPAAHHMCNHHQCGWDDGGHQLPMTLEIHANYPPSERLLLGGENSSQCPAPLTHDSCPPDSSASADLYSPSRRHEGGNMFLAPQSESDMTQITTV